MANRDPWDDVKAAQDTLDICVLGVGMGDRGQLRALAATVTLVVKATAAARAAEARLHQQEVEKLQRRLEIRERAYDRLNLCPDHRDKATGTCIVCQAETRERQELAADFLHLRREHQQELDRLVRNWQLRWVDTNNARESAEARVHALEQERAALQAALNQYGEHSSNCPVYEHPERAGAVCACGLDAALSTPREP